MKFLLLFIFIISCESKTIYKDLSDSTFEAPVNSLSRKKYNENIETMIIFLWPKNLNQSHEKSVESIIRSSRDISLKNDTYLTQFNSLQAKYLKNNCDCHVLGLCDANEDMDEEIMLQCDDIMLEQDENSLLLASLTLDHENIKNELKKIAAINIDIGLEEDIINIGTLNFSTNKLSLNKFIYNNKNTPLKIQLNPYLKNNMKASFNFLVDDIEFKANIDVTEKKYNIIFQGDIKTSDGHEGLIYWEQFK